MLKSHSLPVTKSRLEEWRYSQIEWIQHLVLQHLWQDTFEFLELLQKNNISIAQLVWKPNSVDPKVLQKIKLQLNIPVSVRDYDVLDNTQYLDRLLEKTETDICSILEVWWYYLQPLLRQDKKKLNNILWVVEITKFWHNRYANQLNNNWSTPVPIISLAESSVKEIEADFVSKMWVMAIDLILHKFWKSLANKNVWLLWFWMINSNVSKRLSSFWVRQMTAHDLSSKTYNHMKENNVNPVDKNKLFESSNVIISSTWSTSISLQDIENYAQNGTILVSMWSRGKEYPITEMKKNWEWYDYWDDNVTVFKTFSWKEIFVFYNWVAINYMLQSCPTEAVDPYFSEMLEWLTMLTWWNLSPNKIHTVDKDKQKEIITQRKEWYNS